MIQDSQVITQNHAQCEILNAIRNRDRRFLPSLSKRNFTFEKILSLSLGSSFEMNMK